MDLVTSFVELLQQVAFVFSAPTFNSFLTVLTGWVFARRRIITRMIEAADAVETKHHSAFHRLFAAARWSRDELGLAVFGLIEPWLEDGAVLLSLDDTLARKRGLKIFGVGRHHDPLLSTRKTALMNWGHSWVVLSVIVAFPFRPGHYFSLPILLRLYVNKKTAAKNTKLPYRTRPELAVEMLAILCKRHENRSFHMAGDSTYGGQSVLAHLPANCDLTSRLDLNARLYDAPPLRKPGTNGRPSVAATFHSEAELLQATLDRATPVAPKFSHTRCIPSQAIRWANAETRPRQPAKKRGISCNGWPRQPKWYSGALWVRPDRSGQIGPAMETRAGIGQRSVGSRGRGYGEAQAPVVATTAWRRHAESSCGRAPRCPGRVARRKPLT